MAGMADQGGLERLGRYIVARRKQVGYDTRADFATSVKINARTLLAIENGQRKASPGSYAMIENRLGWRPGSCSHILAGGEPTLTAVHRSELDHISTEDLLAELQRRIVPRKLGNGGWGGLEPFRNWTEQPDQ